MRALTHNWAERIVFLGFGYEPRNLHLLVGQGLGEREVWSTTCGLRGDVRNDAISTIIGPHQQASLVREDMYKRFIDMPCGAFMHEYGSALLR